MLTYVCKALAVSFYCCVSLANPAPCTILRLYMYISCFPVHYMHDKLDDFVAIINTNLQPVFMQIRKGTDENDGKKYYSLVCELLFFLPHFKPKATIIFGSQQPFSQGVNVVP